MRRLKFVTTALAILFAGAGANAQTDKPNTIIKREIIIDAGIEKAWQVLGPEFADAYKWASSINKSEGFGTGENGAPFSERICTISGLGKVKERILEYSEQEYLLSYQVYDGMPKMVKYMSNSWKLIALENGKTKMEMKMEMKTGGLIGAMMKGMMKKKMTKLSQQIMEEFKFYVETGRPHPRKIKALNKRK